MYLCCCIPIDEIVVVVVYRLTDWFWSWNSLHLMPTSNSSIPSMKSTAFWGELKMLQWAKNFCTFYSLSLSLSESLSLSLSVSTQTRKRHQLCLPCWETSVSPPPSLDSPSLSTHSPSSTPRALGDFQLTTSPRGSGGTSSSTKPRQCCFYQLCYIRIIMHPYRLILRINFLFFHIWHRSLNSVPVCCCRFAAPGSWTFA